MGDPAGMDAPREVPVTRENIGKKTQEQLAYFADDYEPPDCCCLPCCVRTSKQPKKEDVSCGYPGCKPRWLQKMADIRAFVIVVSIFYLVHHVKEYYTVAMITTLEKRFGFSSSRASMLLTAREIAYVIFVTSVSHFTDKCHRPRVLAVSGFCVAIGALIYTLPHFLYPRRNIGALAQTPEFINKEFICKTSITLQSNLTQCADPSEWDDDSRSYYILVCGAVITGIFATPVLALSQTYIDDGVGPKRASLYLGFVNMMRPLGPVVAFLLGGAFTSLSENLTVTDPGYDESDPRWIGAWWIGYIVVPCMYLSPVILLFMFPRRIPRDPVKDADYVPPIKQTNDELEKAKAALANQGLCKLGIAIKDFLTALWALLKNPIYMTLQLGGCLSYMTVAGLFPFIPKYLEVMFHLPTFTANIITGILCSLMAAVGVLIGAIISSRWKFSLRQMGICILSMDVIFSILLLLMIPIKCPDIQLVRRSVVNSTCNDNCYCMPDQFQPVCGEDGRSYLSPCDAGCWQSHSNNTWSECGCVEAGGSTVVSGVCDAGCQMWIPFSILLAVGAIVLFVSGVPGITLQLRIVKEEHRSISFGFAGLLFSFIAFVPGPLVYGAIIDSTCDVWRESCGQREECVIYNNDQFQIRSILTTSGFNLLAVILHAAMLVFIKRLERKDTEWTSKETVMTHF